MPKRVMLTYNGITLSKTDWAKELGRSVSSFEARYKKYYPHDLDSLFCPYSLKDADKEQEQQEKRQQLKDPLREAVIKYKLELTKKNQELVKITNEVRELKELIHSLERMIEAM